MISSSFTCYQASVLDVKSMHVYSCLLLLTNFYGHRSCRLCPVPVLCCVRPLLFPPLPPPWKHNLLYNLHGLTEFICSSSSSWYLIFVPLNCMHKVLTTSKVSSLHCLNFSLLLIKLCITSMMHTEGLSEKLVAKVMTCCNACKFGISCS